MTYEYAARPYDLTHATSVREMVESVRGIWHAAPTCILVSVDTYQQYVDHLKSLQQLESSYRDHGGPEPLLHFKGLPIFPVDTCEKA